MSRRRAKGPPPKPFDQAFAGIDTLEIAVVAKTMDVGFKPMDVVRWMLPDDVTDKLQAAFPFTRELDRTAFLTETLMIPVSFPSVQCTFTVKVNSVEIGMLVPARGIARVPGSAAGPAVVARGEPILRTVQQVHTQHLQFEKVRRVVRWLNTHATVGAARHYCPWLTGILPADHPFQEATGQIFREPQGDRTEIFPLMRECGAIMASALLCGDLEHIPVRGLVGVNFAGTRDDEEYASNAFGLL